MSEKWNPTIHLKPGERVQVTTSDGVTTSYVVVHEEFGNYTLEASSAVPSRVKVDTGVRHGPYKDEWMAVEEMRRMREAGWKDYQ